jgi:hypothetical protein
VGILILVIAVCQSGLLSPPPLSAIAAPGSGFDPGMIITDSLFFAAESMNVGQIQGFLNDKGQSCTPAAGGPPCLKDYRQDTTNIAANIYCGGYSGARNETAAEIITKAAIACGISPKVILVLLQKEQRLVTRTRPSVGNYSAATGNACPDTAPCDPNYAGFFYQIYHGARAFQRYVKRPQDYNYQWQTWESILYHPDTRCGRQSVYVQNRATAALYNYTPYVPDAAALTNLYGAGGPCSSYGNRNFWVLYWDWFGSPINGLNSEQVQSLIKALYWDAHVREPDGGGRATWAGALLSQGRPASYVVDGVLASTEYYLKRVDQSYRNVLGREPEPDGRQYWLREIETSRLLVDDLEMIHTESDEFFTVGAQSDPGTFVEILYQKLLGRSASSADRESWISVLNTRGRVAVVRGVYNSEESAARRIHALYENYFQRSADVSGIITYTPIVLNSGDHALRRILVNSGEYLDRAEVRFPS